jgi:hypothetical protein
VKASVTEISHNYQRCRRRWLINSRNRWGMTRIVQAAPLALGTLIHSTLQEWLDLHKSGGRLPADGLARDLYLPIAQKAIHAAREVYGKQTGAELSDGELMPLWESINMGTAMMLNYQKRWVLPVPTGFEIISTEQRVEVPIPGTEHTQEYVWEVPEGAPPYKGHVVLRRYDTPRLHVYQGRLDGILREVASSKLYVLDHKTYGARPREDVLFSDYQFLGYHWMLRALADDMGLDSSMVAGVAYDGLWKRAAPPKTVDKHPGTLQDLFCRILITRPYQELVEFEGMIRDIVLEMANNPPIYHNRTSDGSCFWGCSDNQLCLGMSRGEDTEHRLTHEYTLKSDDDDTLESAHAD